MDDRQVQRESTSENVKLNNYFVKHLGKFLGGKIYFNYAINSLTPSCLPKKLKHVSIKIFVCSL